MIDYAPAKINLYLKVKGKRKDGFHELDTLFQEIDLRDRLEWQPGPQPLSIDMGPEWRDFPTEENLCFKVAKRFKELTGFTIGGHLSIEKHIPAGGGLGGGSSNAMTFIKMMNRHFDSPLSSEQCMQLGNTFGSDLAFFYKGGRQRGTGRGEVLVDMPQIEGGGILFLFPVSLSTGKVFSAVKPEDLSLQGENVNHLLPASLRVSSEFKNLFGQLIPIWPAICMSGSGSSCFVLTDEQINSKQNLILTDLSIKSVSFRFASH